MYEKFFSLSRRPFSMAADPQFLYLSGQHREAATGLIYSILQNKGLATLSGEPGTGKTTVLKAVLASISSASVKAAFMAVPTLSSAEFLEFVLLQFGLASLARANKAERLLMFERFLLNLRANNKTAALVVDEAHKLSSEILEEIRLLTNFEAEDGKLLQIVLSGQRELEELLRQDDMHQFKQRVAYRFSLRSLTELEVASYISHRWARAGGTSSPPFSEEVVRGIARYSQGIPRLINAICDNALVMAFGDGTCEISGRTVFEAARDLDLVEEHHRPVLDRGGETNPSLNDLELLATASSLADSGAIPSLDRRDRPRKESWLSRSARRLMGKEPETT